MKYEVDTYEYWTPKNKWNKSLFKNVNLTYLSTTNYLQKRVPYVLIINLLAILKYINGNMRWIGTKNKCKFHNIVYEFSISHNAGNRRCSYRHFITGCFLQNCRRATSRKFPCYVCFIATYIIFTFSTKQWWCKIARNACPCSTTSRY